MSVPLSLRLCCFAAMAPALTETTSQSRLQLPGSPPPVVSETPISNSSDGLNCAISPLEKVKNKVPLSTELQNTRGLLKPLKSNGIDLQHKLLTDKVKLNLQELGLNANLPNILKQLTVANASLPDNLSSDHIYQKGTSKKMNQPSNGNGPNGTGRWFIKQNSLIDEKALNGHTNNHAAKKIHYNKTLLDPNLGGPNCTNKTIQGTNNTPNMCQTTETGSGAMVNPASTSQTSDRNILANKTCAPLPTSSTDMKPQTMQEVEPKPIDLATDATRKEHLLERRSQFLLRRLRRLQGHQLQSQVKSQLKAFVDYQHQHLQTVASRAIRPFSDLPNTVFNCNDVKNLSTSNLVTLVRKLQASQPKPVLETNKKAKKGVLVMEQTVSSESERKAGHLRTNARHWNDVVDSEATESSSGGESCEEWEDCPVMSDRKVPTPLYKRAEWKWSVDRAAIVARWTWLQAQVSDLEYRIRQQSEIYKTIRTSKGVVTLTDPPVTHLGPGGDTGQKRVPEMSPANVATLMINVSKQASKLTQSLGNCLSPASPQTSINDRLGKDGSKCLNGYVEGSHTPQSSSTAVASASGDNSSVTVSPDLNNQALDSSCVAARCRPVRFYRKRKLLRTAGLHQVNHKAARLSSVRCQCYPPVMSCPMCGGRYNNVQQLDAEGMPIMEKVSLLDPAFHPVLSFPQEIGLTLHFEALLKSGEWQSAKSQPKHTLRSIAAEKRRQKLLSAQMKDQVRKKKKYNKTPAAVLLSSAKLRSKYDGKSPSKTSKKVTAETRLRRKELKRRRAVQLAAAAWKKSMGDTDLDSNGAYSYMTSPSPQMKDGMLSHSASSSTLKDQKDARKKRFENAYDINNIVIPYSMAASTRVEKLQYKEIQTPKWRVVTGDSTEENGSISTDATEQTSMETDQDGEEDVTEEAFLNRHEAPEAEERKRFRSFITYPPVRRSRHSRESESNTHDAVSPECNLNESYNSSNDIQAGFQFSIGNHEGRRRSGSTSTMMSRRGSFLEEYMRSYNELIDREYMDPFAPRQFPLSDETYEDMKLEQLTVSRTKHSYRRARTVRVNDDPSMEFVSPEFEAEESPYVVAVSPAPSVGSSESVEDDNDPEWNEVRGDRRSSVSMRHSKR